nr:PREDICTED: uncharacterized protein LOC109569800 [Bos indicus]
MVNNLLGMNSCHCDFSLACLREAWTQMVCPGECGGKGLPGGHPRIGQLCLSQSTASRAAPVEGGRGQPSCPEGSERTFVSLQRRVALMPVKQPESCSPFSVFAAMARGTRVTTTPHPSSVAPSTGYTPTASSGAFRMCGVCLEWPRLLSGRHLRPVRSAPSCVLTQAAIRDILSCPTYRCTAGSTLVSAFTVQSWFWWLRGGLAGPASCCHCQDTGDFWNAK